MVRRCSNMKKPKCSKTVFFLSNTAVMSGIEKKIFGVGNKTRGVWQLKVGGVKTNPPYF